MPAPPTSEAGDSAHKNYDLPVLSLKAVSNGYECDDEENEKDKKVKEGNILV